LGSFGNYCAELEMVLIYNIYARISKNKSTTINCDTDIVGKYAEKCKR
jgi:hypothetical protein